MDDEPQGLTGWAGVQIEFLLLPLAVDVVGRIHDDADDSIVVAAAADKPFVDGFVETFAAAAEVHGIAAASAASDVVAAAAADLDENILVVAFVD